MRTRDRIALRDIVRDDQSIDLIIVVHADGGTDFFSHRPDVEQCERSRVIAVCRRIADTLEAMPRKTRSDRGRAHGCPGASTAMSACPR